VTGLAALPGVAVRRHGAFGYLPQRLDILNARFLFRGARADQVAAGLSGGERFRAVLAALLLAQPPPQLLVLDEPTNNLDMASVRQLSQALSCYQGALIIASHDVPFLESIGITHWLRIDRDGRLSGGN
jgi:ATPase subunit of ABC transporter with duplicated ATPase domains